MTAAAITIDGCEVACHVFSGGEVQVRVTPKSAWWHDGTATIFARLRSSDNLMALLLATDALRRLGCDDIRLCLPYLPYARQDRVCAADSLVVDGGAIADHCAIAIRARKP